MSGAFESASVVSTVASVVSTVGEVPSVTYSSFGVLMISRLATVRVPALFLGLGGTRALASRLPLRLLALDLRWRLGIRRWGLGPRGALGPRRALGARRGCTGLRRAARGLRLATEEAAGEEAAGPFCCLSLLQ